MYTLPIDFVLVLHVIGFGGLDVWLVVLALRVVYSLIDFRFDTLWLCLYMLEFDFAVQCWIDGLAGG